MKARHRRLLLIVGGLAVVSAIVALVLDAFRSNLVFFFSPTQVAAGEAPKGKPFRVGGVVREGTLRREADGVTLRFVLTDTGRDLTVVYRGLVPDLFKEGKGAVAQGRLRDDGLFVASEVLAKHDENYTPPEVARAVGDARAQTEMRKAAIGNAARTFRP